MSGTSRHVSRPAVSIVMPVYNGAKYLREAIDSVLGQTLGEWELLVGDDGSADSSREIVESYRDLRLRHFLGPGRRGIFGNLNDLTRRARSRYVKILCQDDVMAPECLERQLDFMLARPRLAFCRIMQVDDPANVSFREQQASLGRLPDVIEPPASAIAFFAFGNFPGNLSCLMFRSAAWRRARGFREDLPYAADMEFWFRLARAAPCGIVRSPAVFVRSHKDQASVALNTRNELVAQMDRVLEEVHEALPQSLRGGVTARLWGTAAYVTQYIHRAIRISIEGGQPNWRAVTRHRSFAYAFPIALLLYMASLNRRVGLGLLERRLLDSFQELQSVSVVNGGDE